MINIQQLRGVITTRNYQRKFTVAVKQITSDVQNTPKKYFENTK